MTSQFDFIDALGDGVYGVDTAGHCLFVNKAAIRILGYDRAEDLVGRNMHEVIHHTRPDGSHFAQSDCPLLHTAISGRPVRLDNEMLWRRDGSPFFAEYSAFPIIADGKVTGSVITFNDSAVRRDAQTRLAVQFTVSQILGGTSGNDILPARLLAAIGTGLAWETGRFWQADPAAALDCVAQWSSPQDADLAGFCQCSMALHLQPAEGLPGRACATRTPIYDANYSNLGPGDENATRFGLRSAFAFPVMAGTRVLGAMEFFSRRRIDVDDSLIEAASTLGQQIGQTLEQRRISAALAAAQDLTGAILASAPDAVITVDDAGQVVDFNRAATQMFGRPLQSVMGRALAPLIFPPETLALHRQLLRDALGGDDTALGHHAESEAIRSDGARFPIELQVTKTAERPRKLFTLHMRDITNRRSEQARLRESEARFRTIANAIPQLAWMTDPAGAIIWYNQRWFDYTGTTLEAMAGWGWKTVHHPEHIERVERRLRTSFESGAPWEDTFPLRAADGSYRWFLSRALPIHEEPSAGNPQGRRLGWFGTNTDITALRDSEQTLATARDQAEAANRAKSTFIANMSHELRTPLSAIIGYAEMLGEEIADGAEPGAVADDVRKIEGNARHLLGLINDVLDLAKVESGKMEPYAETFDIAALCQDVAATIRSLVEKKGNRLALQLGGDLGSAHSDVTRIRQIMLNLLSNAAKFTERGTVTLAVTREGSPSGTGQLRIAVHDTGIGLTEAQLAKLFQRFQQADTSTTRQFGGSGLGLALTRAFCALLGGTITVSSIAGQGSVFTALLPVTLPVAAAPEPVAEAALPDPAPDRRETVLVIDDDATQRDLMRRFLNRNGFAPCVAADGETGLALARRFKPRAILLDVTMPGMDGWSVLAALKADPDLSGIPVVMVTFLSERPLAMSMGAADYVVKPVDWDRLRHVMERVRAAEDRRLRQTVEKNGQSITNLTFD